MPPVASVFHCHLYTGIGRGQKKLEQKNENMTGFTVRICQSPIPRAMIVDPALVQAIIGCALRTVAL
jgi:hypothetical protein